MKHRTTSARVTAALAAGALAALGLSACTSNWQHTQGEPQASPPALQVSPEPAPSTATVTNIDALTRAGSTALGAVDGATVTSIDIENGGELEVEVTTADGTEHKIMTTPDGSSIIRGPRTSNDDASERAKHQRRLGDAHIGYIEAANAIAATVGGGKIVELELDTYARMTVWEGDVITSSGTKHEVTISAEDGSVKKSSID